MHPVVEKQPYREPRAAQQLRAEIEVEPDERTHQKAAERHGSRKQDLFAGAKLVMNQRCCIDSDKCDKRAEIQ